MVLETLAAASERIFYVVAILNLATWASLLVLLVAFLTKPSFWPSLKKHLSRYANRYSLLFAAVATGGSLWLSEIMGVVPCELCWFQRIFMYPLVLVFLVALWKRTRVRTLSISMSAIGGLIALYHYGVQRLAFLQGSVKCLSDASCSTMYLGYWGFYSIPLMALTAFAAILALQLFFAEE